MSTAKEMEVPTTRPVVYKVYKRRFWGLAQLVLLNIVVSWDVCLKFSEHITKPFPDLISENYI
jgi:hypothetical protein